MEESEEKSNKNDFLIHYKKINIMGDEFTGKSSLIAFFENYHNKNFVIPNNENRLSRSLSIDSANENNLHLVEQIKKITVAYNGLVNLYLNIYETNLNQIENIKNYLEDLLFQTECIILIFEKNNIDSFANIKKMIPIIIEKIKKEEILNIPIFILKNKVDEQDTNINDAEKIKSDIGILKEEYKQYITFIEISLLNRDSFEDFIYDFYSNCYTNSKISKNNFVNSIKLNDPLRIADKGGILNKEEKDISIQFLGDSSVGKTSFINSYHGKFKVNYLSTIGIERYEIYAEVNSQKYIVKLWDTSGQEKFRSIPKSYYKNARCFLLFFDVTKPETFENINNWIKSISDNSNDKNKIIYLIGNKIDLHNQRKVSKDEAKNFAKKYNVCYHECSCSNGIGVYEIINEIIYRGAKICPDEKIELDNNPKQLKQNNQEKFIIKNKEKKSCYGC